jgi:hypothetical protein
MTSILRAVALAAVSATATWAVERFFEKRRLARGWRRQAQALQTWEGEGGAVAPDASVARHLR